MPSQQDKQKIQQTILTVIIMKKILFVALAAVGLTACVQNEELAISKSNAITFDNVYVGNATKAAIDGSYTSAKGNLDHFNVWATISNTNGTANIFEDEAVTKNNAGVWSYAVENTQYWIPGNNYSFVGVVDGDVVVDANAYNMPLTIATSLSSQKDVLYATQSRSYNGETVTPVHFDFEHLLAKVKFTAKNTVTTQYSELYYTVESIVITNADNEAVYSIANGTWTPSSTYTAEFGAVTTSNDAGATASNLAYGQNAESNYELLVLPQQNKSLKIKVNYTLHKDDWYQTYEKEMTAANLNIEKGRAYNFVLALGNPGASIDFTAEVEDWIEENTPVYADVTEVATAEQFETAFAHQDVNTIILGEDVVLGASATRSAVDPTLVLNNGKSLTIDLNGHKLSATSSQNGNREMFLVKGNLTIKNGTIEYQHVGENMGWNAMTTIFDVTAGGVLNLEGVTAKNLGGSDMGFVAHLNNWGEVTLNVNNSTLESNYVAVRVFNSGNDMNNVAIKNSTLKGGNYAFWVHNYTVADFGTEAKFEAHKALLNLDVFNASNTFVGKNNTPIRFGMTNALYFGLVSTEAELKEILVAGWSVILAEDIVLAEALKVASEKNSVIDLNGHTLSGVDNGTASYGLITNNGNLTIEGPGKIQLSATNNRGWNAYSSVISNGPNGVLVVNGGTIEHLGGTDMAYGIDILTNGGIGDSHCTINGGHIKSTYRAIRQFLNSDSKMNTLVVNGGVIEGANKSIWMQDPSKKSNKGALTVAAGAQLKGDVYLFVTAGSTEWPVEVSIASAALVGESTVLTGNVPAQYEVVEENGAWVVKEIEGVIVKTVEELKSALNNAEIPSIVLAGGETFEGTFLVGRDVTVSSSASNKATLKGRVNVVNASVLFNNIKFDRNETDSSAAWNTAYGSSSCLQYKAVVMIYGDATRSIKFEGCEFYNSNGSHKSSITNVSCDLSLNNCYLQGTSSSIYSQANLSVTNSTIDYTGTNNVVLSINGCGNNGGKVIFTGNKVVNEVFALGQFLGTVAFGNGTYYFDIQNNEGTFTNYFFNTSRVANKEFAAGSLTF